MWGVDAIEEFSSSGINFNPGSSAIATYAISATATASQDMGDKTNVSRSFASGALLDITNISQSGATFHAAETLKRCTNMVPKKVPSTDASRSRSRPPSGSKTLASFSATGSLPARATGLYCGSLNTAELDAGYGMGMAVTAANSRRFISRQSSTDHTGVCVYCYSLNECF